MTQTAPAGPLAAKVKHFDHGGVANPGPHGHGYGLTIADEFAAHVAAGIVSRVELLPHPIDVAEWAYNQAEALVAEKRKRENRTNAGGTSRE